MASQADHLYFSQILCTLRDFFIEFEVSGIRPNSVLFPQKAYNILKDIFPNMIKDNKFLYNDILLDIIIVQSDEIGMAITYSSTLNANT